MTTEVRRPVVRKLFTASEDEEHTIDMQKPPDDDHPSTSKDSATNNMATMDRGLERDVCEDDVDVASRDEKLKKIDKEKGSEGSSKSQKRRNRRREKRAEKAAEKKAKSNNQSTQSSISDAADVTTMEGNQKRREYQRRSRKRKRREKSEKKLQEYPLALKASATNLATTETELESNVSDKDEAADLKVHLADDLDVLVASRDEVLKKKMDKEKKGSEKPPDERPSTSKDSATNLATMDRGHERDVSKDGVDIASRDKELKKKIYKEKKETGVSVGENTSKAITRNKAAGNPIQILSSFQWQKQKETDSPPVRGLAELQNVLAKERKMNNQLCKYLGNVTGNAIDQRHTHAHCTHEKMMDSGVSLRTLEIVSNAVFSDSYCYPETELETIPLEVVSLDEVGGPAVKLKSPHYVGKVHRIHKCVLSSGQTVCVKECKGGLNRSPHEYRILKRNIDVSYIPEAFGIWHRQSVGLHLVSSWEGEVSLHQAIQKGFMLSRKRVLPVLLCIATAMEELHANGFLHNKICPSNIVLKDGNDGHACLVDFAMACSIGKARCLTKQQVQRNKTNLFMAPELKSGSVGPSTSSDVYSFGETVKHVFIRKQDCLPHTLLDLGNSCAMTHPDDRCKAGYIATHLGKMVALDNLF